MTRIAQKFQQLKSQNKKAFIAYICAGDPDYETSLEILNKLPENGADLIELGVPFLDPSGDGPVIESASKRSIENGMNLVKTLKMVEEFRQNNQNTPIILMGYFNNFLKYGIEKFCQDACKKGIDAILIVDLPLEEKHEIANHAHKNNLDLINLISPITNESRIKEITQESSGFIYLVSMLGITGTKQAKPQDNQQIIKKIRQATNLPIAIGFGIKNAETAQEFKKIDIDGFVVGSTIVKEVQKSLQNNENKVKLIENVLNKVKEFQ